ncbi:MAG TPA: hypothetical protein EYG89_05705 [Bacteroidia bacterium]|nr:hypothetical protein [Bacteroidia bacterium]
MQKEFFHKEIVNFIQENNQKNTITIKTDTNLIETKIVDSLLLTEIILFVEDISNNSIDIESFDINSFKSIDIIYDTYIQSR